MDLIRHYRPGVRRGKLNLYIESNWTTALFKLYSFQTDEALSIWHLIFEGQISRKTYRIQFIKGSFQPWVLNQKINECVFRRKWRRKFVNHRCIVGCVLWKTAHSLVVLFSNLFRISISHLFRILKSYKLSIWSVGNEICLFLYWAEMDLDY